MKETSTEKSNNLTSINQKQRKLSEDQTTLSEHNESLSASLQIGIHFAGS